MVTFFYILIYYAIGKLAIHTVGSYTTWITGTQEHVKRYQETSKKNHQSFSLRARVCFLLIGNIIFLIFWPFLFLALLWGIVRFYQDPETFTETRKQSFDLFSDIVDNSVEVRKRNAEIDKEIHEFMRKVRVKTKEEDRIDD